MTDKPAEILLFDYLTEQINSAAGGDVIYDLELHDTIYQTIRKTRGLRISDAVGTFSPGPENDEKEYDTFVTIAAYSRIPGKDKTERQAAVIDVFQIQREVYRVCRIDSTLGGRVCESMLLRGGRGYDVFDGEPYAVANIPLIVNPSGAHLAGSSY